MVLLALDPKDEVVQVLSSIPYFFWFQCDSCGMMFTSNWATCPQCGGKKVVARVYRTGYMFKNEGEKALQQLKEFFGKLNWKIRSLSVQDNFGAYSAICLVEPKATPPAQSEAAAPKAQPAKPP